MSNDNNIQVQPPSPIPSLRRGRKPGSSKYPFSTLTIAVKDGGSLKGPFFEAESKTASGIYSCGKRAVPGAKFAIRKALGEDGAQRTGPKGKLLWGVWRVK